MQTASPARLYATAVGGALVAFGVLGFFYSASFGNPGGVGEVLGVFAVNGWHNLLHIFAGAIGLLVAGFAARGYALWLGGLYVGIAAWGFIIGAGEAILGLIPVNTADNFLHLLLGLLGLLAWLATPVERRRPAVAT